MFTKTASERRLRDWDGSIGEDGAMKLGLSCRKHLGRTSAYCRARTNVAFTDGLLSNLAGGGGDTGLIVSSIAG